MTLFFERFVALCRENNTSPNAVAKKLSISSGSVTAWKRGSYPRMETVQRLADYFHVTADYLIGNVNEPFFSLDNDRIKNEINSYGDDESDPSITFDDFTYAMHNHSGNLTEKDKDILLSMAEQLAAANKMRKRNGETD